MTIWEQLGIERTTDKRKIRHAYAKLAVQYHQEGHPEEVNKIYQAYREALSYASKPVFDEDLDAVFLEELENVMLFWQPSEQEKELIQMRMIDEVLENIQSIILVSEKNIIQRFIEINLGSNRRLTEWKSLLVSSDFQKVRRDRNFIVKLNELKCISLLSADMAERLYEKLDFEFIEERFEKTDYQDLQFRLQQCVDRVEEWRKDREEVRAFFHRVKLIFYLIVVSVIPVLFVLYFVTELMIKCG